MNYQKDTKNNDLNSYGQGSAPSDKIIVNKDIYTYSYKKTEKLVTALYMVTDCMDRDDFMKGKVRNLGIETLSHMHKLSRSNVNPVDNKVLVASSLNNIDEIISLIGIAHTIGFISDMNTAILKKELKNLSEDLRVNQEKDNHFTFTLDENIFNLPRPVEPSNNKPFSVVKDKRTEYNMSFTNHRANTPLSLTKGLRNSNLNIGSKEDRALKILLIIKDKKSLIGNEAGVSIKDISAAFTDCSEKTIQRELNTLVSKNTIKKTGAKRWSRYQAV